MNTKQQKRKHKTLTVAEKFDILNRLDRNESLCKLAKLYNIGRSTIYDIKQNRERIQNIMNAAAKKKAKHQSKEIKPKSKMPRANRSLYWKFFGEKHDNKATCNICGTTVKLGGGTSNLKQHMQRNHSWWNDEKEFKPKFENSDASFNMQCTDSQQAVVKCWLDLSWTCVYCEKNFTDFIFFKNHLQSEHELDNIEDVRFHCNDCSEEPHGYSSYLNHVRGFHYENLKLCCDVCNKNFQGYKELASHRSKHIETLNTSFPTAFNCTQCENSFTTEKLVKLHTHKYHNPLFSILAEDCNDEIANKSSHFNETEENTSHHIDNVEKMEYEAIEKSNDVSEGDLSNSYQNIKHSRGNVFSAKESTLLLKCLEKYKKIVDCKKMDKESNDAKNEAWKNITEEFNKRNNQPRDTNALRVRYKNMRSIAKNKAVRETAKLEKFECLNENETDEKDTEFTDDNTLEMENFLECDTEDVEISLGDNDMPTTIAMPLDEPHNLLNPPYQKIKRKNYISAKKWQNLSEEKIKLIKEEALQQRQRHEQTLKNMKEEHALKMQILKQELDQTKAKFELQLEILKKDLLRE